MAMNYPMYNNSTGNIFFQPFLFSEGEAYSFNLLKLDPRRLVELFVYELCFYLSAVCLPLIDLWSTVQVRKFWYSTSFHAKFSEK